MGFYPPPGVGFSSPSVETLLAPSCQWSWTLTCGDSSTTVRPGRSVPRTVLVLTVDPPRNETFVNQMVLTLSTVLTGPSPVRLCRSTTVCSPPGRPGFRPLLRCRLHPFVSDLYLPGSRRRCEFPVRRFTFPGVLRSYSRSSDRTG